MRVRLARICKFETILYFFVIVLGICHSYYIREDGGGEADCENELAGINGHDRNGRHSLQDKKLDEEFEFQADQRYYGEVWVDDWRD